MTPSEIPTKSIYRNFPVRVIVTLFYDRNAFTQLHYQPPQLVSMLSPA